MGFIPLMICLTKAILASCSPTLPLSGIIHKIDDRTWTVTAVSTITPNIQLSFLSGPSFVLDYADDDMYVLPSNASIGRVTGRGTGWILPQAANSTDAAWMITTPGSITISYTKNSTLVSIDSAIATLKQYRARPHADINGSEFVLSFPGSGPLTDAMAAFYWTTMVPSIVERTLASSYPDSDGFVLSTLASTYAGTYPDVDHEFQIKGRHAAGSAVDRDVARRMMELQLRLAHEDPCGLWRVPCAVQPDGTREYHVRRNSFDGAVNANMFLVTGNVELLEAAWMHVAYTKDVAWLIEHIGALEQTAEMVASLVDEHGRLWGDVFYEDQVMKDGRETLAQVLAARSFGLLAQLEDILGRNDSSIKYALVADTLMDNVAQPLPLGSWDPVNRRFIDWVDRLGMPHDHMHLLANILPVIFGAANADQMQAVLEIMFEQWDEFQRFPTFISPKVEDYTLNEMGVAGPYDLCAAGRYWYWDAAFWAWQRRGDVILQQLQKVAAMAASEGYVMGERYDMDHVYYIDGSPWHGAAHYYEYPCVFLSVMMNQLLGLKPSLDADLEVSPRLPETGSVLLEQHAYQLSYEYQADVFTLQNLASEIRTFRVDVRALYPDALGFTLSFRGSDEETEYDGEVITIPASESISITPTSHSFEVRRLEVQFTI